MIRMGLFVRLTTSAWATTVAPTGPDPKSTIPDLTYTLSARKKAKAVSVEPKPSSATMAKTSTKAPVLSGTESAGLKMLHGLVLSSVKLGRTQSNDARMTRLSPSAYQGLRGTLPRQPHEACPIQPELVLINANTVKSRRARIQAGAPPPALARSLRACAGT